MRNNGPLALVAARRSNRRFVPALLIRLRRPIPRHTREQMSEVGVSLTAQDAKWCASGGFDLLPADLSSKQFPSASRKLYGVADGPTLLRAE